MTQPGYTGQEKKITKEKQEDGKMNKKLFFESITIGTAATFKCRKKLNNNSKTFTKRCAKR